jgi:ATP-dependent Clp protease ATP-binding subunit ClpC
VFERFSEEAREVVVFAQDEARELRHNYIGTEHLLLGLLRQRDGVAARVLTGLGVTLAPVRAEVAKIVGQGDAVTAGQIPFTPRAKKVLELGLREALSLGHNYIGSEHILLGIAREDDGVAARLLADSGVDAETVRGAVVRETGARPSSASRENEPSFHPRGMRSRGRCRPPFLFAPLLFVAGWLLFAVPLGIGILVGWLIWG